MFKKKSILCICLNILDEQHKVEEKLKTYFELCTLKSCKQKSVSSSLEGL